MQKDSTQQILEYTNGNFICRTCGKKNEIGVSQPLQCVDCSKCNTQNIIPKKINEFWLYDVLSSDDIGTIFLGCLEELPFNRFAVKQISDDGGLKSKKIDQLNLEATIANELGVNSSIYTGIEFGLHGDEPYLVTEISNGERLDCMVECHGGLSEIDASVIILQLLTAAIYIYQRGYIYYNFDPVNIFTGESTSAYIYNYRYCAPTTKLTNELVSCGNELYSAPEVFAGEEIGTHSVIYSLGLLFYYIISGKPLLTDYDIKALQLKWKNDTMKLASEDPKFGDINPEFGNILGRMVTPNPQHRYHRFSALERDIVNVLAEAF